MVDAHAGLGDQRAVTLLGDLDEGAQIHDVGHAEAVDEVAD
jgi:hypothetical protein